MIDRGCGISEKFREKASHWRRPAARGGVAERVSKNASDIGGLAAVKIRA